MSNRLEVSFRDHKGNGFTKYLTPDLAALFTPQSHVQVNCPPDKMTDRSLANGYWLIVSRTVIFSEVNGAMERADTNNRATLVSVSLAALSDDAIMVCCLFEVGR